MCEADLLSEMSACLKAGDLDGAAKWRDQVLTQHPLNPRAWHLSGIVYAQQGELVRAAECFQQAAEADRSNALYHYNLGLAYQGLGRTEDALLAYRAAIDRRPNFLEARNNLANGLMQIGENEAALKAFRELCDLFPDQADCHFNLANLLQDTGNFQEAREHYLRALELDPDHSAARENLGRAYTDLGLSQEANQVWRDWLERDPDSAVAQHMVDSTSGQTTIFQCAANYVRETFNQDFAKNFDSQLARLGYQAPQLISDALAAVTQGNMQEHVLDAGCGTGLCGPLVRPIADRLIGVDLSADMLAQARQRQVYDELIEDELTNYLGQHRGAFDAILCADTLCYFGDLGAVLAAAAQSTRRGGWFIFTVECAPAGEPALGYQLQPHGRFCHSEAYVVRTLEAAGFDVQHLESATLRKERGRPVQGLVVTTVRSA